MNFSVFLRFSMSKIISRIWIKKKLLRMMLTFAKMCPLLTVSCGWFNLLNINVEGEKANVDKMSRFTDQVPKPVGGRSW